MKTTLPSPRLATPPPSRSSDSTFSHCRWGGTAAAASSMGDLAAGGSAWGDVAGEVERISSVIPRLSQGMTLFPGQARGGPWRCAGSACGQRLGGVDRLALLAHFE